MPDKEKEAIRSQQQKRKRINRIKNGIILTIASWMLVSITVIIILVVQVIGLNHSVRKLKSNVASIEGVDSEISSEEEEKYANVVTGVDTEDNMYTEGDTQKVYLTFETVPSENTNAILDVLAEYNIKATFFVCGDDSEEAKAIYKRIVEEGHTLGMNSYVNDFSQIYQSIENFSEDFHQIQDYLREVTGVTSVYYRFPGGTFNQVSDVNFAEFVHVLNQEEITYFDWNVDAGDSGNSYTVDDVVLNVTQGVANYKTSVVRLHDSESRGTTVEALGTLIETLQDSGVELLPIDDSTYKVQYIKAESVE
ncbi:MAG: hypothetical protein E7282_06360 [Lachnospiraceae bacterium]|nr:hypothetical protein [Lachnospiraceae bacterium]